GVRGVTQLARDPAPADVYAERAVNRTRRRERIDERGPFGEQRGPRGRIEPDQLRDRRMVEGNEERALEEAARRGCKREDDRERADHARGTYGDNGRFMPIVG